MIGDQQVEMPVALVDRAEVVVPEEHRQLPIAQRRLRHRTAQCVYIASHAVYIVQCTHVRAHTVHVRIE